MTLSASEENKDGPRKIQKRVQIIMNCSCMSCEKVQKHDCEIADQNTLELPTDLFASLQIVRNPSEDPPPALNATKNQIPELAHQVVTPKNRSENATRPRYELNTSLLRLLRAIQEESDEDNFSSLNYDKHLLKELLDMVEGSERQLSDRNLMDFVGFANEHAEGLELNVGKLRDVLTSFREEQELIERHKAFGLGSIVLPDADTANANIERDLKLMSKKFGLEGSHLGLGRLTGNHIGMGIGLKAKDETQTKSVPPHLLHRVGDEEHVGAQNGHLVAGPHGALVFQPDLKVEEKLNIDSDMVKPNQEGLVMSYVNHPKN